MENQEQFAALLQRMRGMSAADLSVLDAGVHTPESNMATAPGSANEALWSEMVKLGWMSTKQDVLELGGGARYVMNTYSILPEGIEPISSLLAALANG